MYATLVHQCCKTDELLADYTFHESKLYVAKITLRTKYVFLVLK